MTIRLALSRCTGAALALTSSLALAVDCTPEDITLDSQQAVDQFQTNHGPGCNRIVGKLTVSGTDITQLDGLAGVDTIYWLELINNPVLTDITGLGSISTTTGPIDIFSNPSLTNLSGLDGVTDLDSSLTLLGNASLTDISALSNLGRIGSSLFFRDNDALINLDALSSLTSVGFAIIMQGNFLLESVSGLSSVTDFTGTIYFQDSPSLTSLDGIPAGPELTGLIIRRNDLLSNLDPLSGLTAVGNDYSDMVIEGNSALVDISGLAELISLNAGIEISGNTSLATCSPLARLLDQVDDGAPGPGPGSAGIPDVNGEVVVGNNRPGCNSVPDIVSNPPAGKTILYGGLASGRDQLLLRGSSVRYNCLNAPVATPTAGLVSASRIAFACSALAFDDGQTLVYDIKETSCQTVDAFTRSTRLFTDAVYGPTGMAGDTLEEAAENIFADDPLALLQFDPASGELRRGETMVCARGRIVFANGFER